MLFIEENSVTKNKKSKYICIGKSKNKWEMFSKNGKGKQLAPNMEKEQRGQCVPTTIIIE